MTRAPDPIAPLIPWHATGRLAAEDRARVEEHLAACDACRDLLASARAFRRVAPGVELGSLLSHVQAQLLVEYASDPGALEPDARSFAASHVASCTVCAEALEILEDLGSTAPASFSATPAEPAKTAASPGMARRAWRFITRSFLHPLPALVYLVALVALLVAPLLREPAPGPDSRPAVSVLPRAAVLPEELVARGTDTAPPPPIEVPLGAGEEQVVLELVTSVETERLRDPAVSFRVEITEGDRSVFESVLRGSDFEPTGRLRLSLDPGALAAGPVHIVRLTFVKAGDPFDGEDVFRRSFRLVAAASPPS